MTVVLGVFSFTICLKREGASIWDAAATSF